MIEKQKNNCIVCGIYAINLYRMKLSLRFDDSGIEDNFFEIVYLCRDHFDRFKSEKSINSILLQIVNKIKEKPNEKPDI